MEFRLRHVDFAVSTETPPICCSLRGAANQKKDGLKGGCFNRGGGCAFTKYQTKTDYFELKCKKINLELKMN